MKYRAVAAVALCVFTLLASPLAAEGTSSSTSLDVMGAYYFPNHAGFDTPTEFLPIDYSKLTGASGQRDIGSDWGGAEIKAVVDHKMVFPALVGTGDLTKDNNLAVDVSGELSPVSINAKAEATLTPIAFLQFSAGAGLGTGWDVPGLATGLGINNAGAIEVQNFGGIVWHTWVSGTFQFDLAAVMPGDWNHVVVLASPKIEYKAYSGADAGQAWLWEADDGMDFNGWKLSGSYVLAYQMPLALNMAGFLFEPEEWIGDVRALSPQKDAAGTVGWGSDVARYTLNLLFNIKINDKSSIAILPSIKNNIKWTDATTKNLFFENRVFEGTYWYFNRVAFDFSLKL
jgi:hypothetical protein